MMVTTYEKGIAKGLEQGLKKGLEEGREQSLREVARLLLERKFGPLSEAVLARLATAPAGRLGELLIAVLDAASLADLGLEDGDGKM